MQVSLAFTKLGDPELDAFGEGVINGFSTHVELFPTPPVTVVNLTATLGQFTTAMAKAKAGGPADTAAKNAARENLLSALRTDAAYVEETVDNLADLLCSGYKAVSENHSQSPLPQPVIRSVTNGTSGFLNVRVDPVRNAHAFEARISATSVPAHTAAVSTDSQHIQLTDLTPGTLYTIQVRAVGGSTGYSPWSEPATHMAT